VISPLSVATHKKKLRLILNLRYVNGHLDFPKFRYELLTDICDIFDPDDSVFSCDIQSAYHHVPVHVEDRPYLGFCWLGTCYRFKVLPFGLAPSPLVFSKIVGVLVQHWRSQGFHVHAYLDDILAGGRTSGSLTQRGHAEVVRLHILKDLTDAGFLLSARKAHLHLVRRIRHLGMIIDFDRRVFTPPQSKFEALRTACLGVQHGPGRIPTRWARV